MGKLCCSERYKEEIIENIVDEEVLYDVAELFKAFADSTRIKIISLLKGQRLCVNSISDILNISQSAISHQLKILKNAKIVIITKATKRPVVVPKNIALFVLFILIVKKSLLFFIKVFNSLFISFFSFLSCSNLSSLSTLSIILTNLLVKTFRSPATPASKKTGATES